MARRGGFLRGQQGKSYAIVVTPEEAASKQVAARDVGEQIAKLRGEVRELADRLDTSDDTISRVEDNLVDLYGKSGFDYPHDGPPEVRRGEASMGRPSSAGKVVSIGARGNYRPNYKRIASAQVATARKTLGMSSTDLPPTSAINSAGPSPRRRSNAGRRAAVHLGMRKSPAAP